MKIILLRNRARNNKVDKTAFLDFVDVINGEYKSILDKENPVLLIKKNSKLPPEFNYIYIEDLDIYYYVNHIDIINTKLYTIYCHIDILMTYRNYIYNLNAFVDRNQFSYYKLDRDSGTENVSRSMFVDERIILKDNITFFHSIITNDVFNVDNGRYGSYCLTGLDIGSEVP